VGTGMTGHSIHVGARTRSTLSAFGVIPLTRFKFLLILALVIVAPYQNSLNLVLGFSTRPVILGTLAVLFLDGLRVLAQSGQKPSLMEQAALLWIALAILYIPMAIFTAGSVARGILAGIYGFLLQFQGVFAYFAIRSLRLSAAQAKAFLLALVVSLVLMVGYAFYEFLFARYALVNWLVSNSAHPFVQDQASLMQSYYRMKLSGPAFYRSQSFELEFVSFGYSGFVTSSLVLAMCLLSRRWCRRPLAWIAVVVSSLGLVSSFTISSIASFLVSALLVLCVRTAHKGVPKLGWMGLLVAAAILVAVTILAAPHVVAPIRERLANLQLVERHEVHADAASEYLGRVVPSLFIGRGTGTAGPGSSKFLPKEEYRLFIENEYLGNIAEWGVPGLLIYLFFMFTLARHLIHLLRLYRYGSLGYALLVGLFSVALGYAVIGFYHNVWGQSSIDVQFMSLVALCTQGSGFLHDLGPAPLGHCRAKVRLNA